jgi:hypothetical protein
MMPFFTARKTFLRTSAPLPSIKLPATMNRVSLMNIFFLMKPIVPLMFLIAKVISKE